MTIISKDIDVGYTQIRSGKRGNPNRCPIALAVRKVFHDADVRVFPDTDIQCIGVYWILSIRQGCLSISYNLSKYVSSRAQLFDKTGVMEPFSFKLEI